VDPLRRPKASGSASNRSASSRSSRRTPSSFTKKKKKAKNELDAVDEVEAYLLTLGHADACVGVAPITSGLSTNEVEEEVEDEAGELPVILAEEAEIAELQGLFASVPNERPPANVLPATEPLAQPPKIPPTEPKPSDEPETPVEESGAAAPEVDVLEEAIVPVVEEAATTAATEAAEQAPAEKAPAAEAAPAAVAVLPVAYDSLDALLDKRIVELKADADIRLLHAGHVIELWRAGGRFERRQALPESAFLAKRPTFVIVLSYGWLSKEAPDPDGWHLAIVGPLLELFVRSAVEAGKLTSADEVGFFIDFGCLWQAPRDEAQKASFGRGLRCANYLYANRRTHVWAQTKMPVGTVRDYHARGWTFFELIVSSIVKDTDTIHARPSGWDRMVAADANRSFWGLAAFLDVRVLDLSKLEPTEREIKLGLKSNASIIDPSREPDFHRIAFACSIGVVRAPLSLDAFGDELGKREFTNGKSDHDAVVELYSRTIDEVMSAVTELTYAHCNWRDADAVQLAAVLPRCTKLRTLWLYGNPFGDEGAAAVIKSLPPGVARLNLNITRASCDLPREMLSAKDGGGAKNANSPKRLQFMREWAKSR